MDRQDKPHPDYSRFVFAIHLSATAPAAGRRSTDNNFIRLRISVPPC
jgi:hypothetical protein